MTASTERPRVGRRAAWLLGALVTALTASACVPNEVDDYCDSACGCEDCDEEEREGCGIMVRARIDIADGFGCGDQYLELLACEAQHGDCRKDERTGRKYYTQQCDNECRCSDERDEWDKCLNKASAANVDIIEE